MFFLTAKTKTEKFFTYIHICIKRIYEVFVKTQNKKIKKKKETGKNRERERETGYFLCHSFDYSFICVFNCLFVYSFIHSFIPLT